MVVAVDRFMNLLVLRACYLATPLTRASAEVSLDGGDSASTWLKVGPYRAKGGSGSLAAPFRRGDSGSIRPNRFPSTREHPMQVSHPRAAALAAIAIVLAADAVTAQAVGRRDSIYRAMLDFPALVERGSLEPQWMADRRSFWFLEQRGDTSAALKVDPATGTVSPLLDRAKTREALRRALGYEPPHHGLPFPTFSLAPDEQAVLFELDGRRWRLDLAGYQARPLGPVAPGGPGAGTGPRPGESASPDGRWFARVEGGNLWLRSPIDGRSLQLTTDGADRHGYLGPPFGSIQWSPTGTRLLVVKQDLRRVRHIPVIHWLKPEEEQIEWSPYQHAGSAVGPTELSVIEVARRAVIPIDAGDEAERQLRPAGWRKDGEEAYFLRTDRLIKRVDLLAADPRTGKTRLLVTERQPTFVEGLALNPGSLFTPFSDGSKFIWRSERDGWSHLYLYQGDGTLIRRLTQGTFPVDSVVAIDEKRGWVYFLARDDRARPYDLHFYRVDLNGGRFTRLTGDRGEHAVTLSPDLDFFVDTYSTVSQPPVIDLRRADGTKVRELARADIDKLTALGWKPPEEFTVKAADQTTDLYGALYRPYDFDPARKYPVIDLQYMGNFVHSAPHRFHRTWLGDEAQALTQLGFIVFIVDGRGTTGRGKAFQDHTYHAIGTFEVADQVAALRQLAATRPWMDTSRVGITGFSWGGYYTIRALLTAPEVFKVGVAGAPVVDFLAHSAPIEPYMGLPQENREGYAQGSNIGLADRLQGRLLITIGTSDVNVTFNHTMRMADAFIKAGKHFDLVVMPGETHGLTPAGMAYYKDARARYFVEHLMDCGGPVPRPAQRVGCPN
jgi:dipeptidyl aminopeptidase/acylaminoacyl peptidase